METCSESSRYAGEGNWGCAQPYNDVGNGDYASNGEGVGLWIEYQFANAYDLTRMFFGNRGSGEANSHVRLTFLDGSEELIDLNLTIADLDVKSTTSVRLIVTQVYGTKNNGARNIKFYGKPSIIIFLQSLGI